MLNFLRAYLEAIKIFKSEPEYTLKALSQFSKVNDLELLKEAYEYNRARIPDVRLILLWWRCRPWWTHLGESDPKAAKADAKKFIDERFLKKLEEEGFVRKLFGR